MSDEIVTCDAEFGDGTHCPRPADRLQRITRSCGCVPDRWAPTCPTCANWDVQRCYECRQSTVTVGAVKFL